LKASMLKTRKAKYSALKTGSVDSICCTARLNTAKMNPHAGGIRVGKERTTAESVLYPPFQPGRSRSRSVLCAKHDVTHWIRWRNRLGMLHFCGILIGDRRRQLAGSSKDAQLLTPRVGAAPVVRLILFCGMSIGRRRPPMWPSRSLPWPLDKSCR
jgi:hypothetical protein